MTQYYYLSAALPTVQLGKKPAISFHELEPLLSQNLSRRDLLLWRKFRLYFDLQNLQAFFTEKPIDEKGIFSKKDLGEALLLQMDLPTYVIDFLQEYRSNQERLAYFPSLYVSFFSDIRGGNGDFTDAYFTFERGAKLVLAALRAKKWGKDIAYELQFEDPKDPLVAEILAAKHQASFDPPPPYEELKEIFERYQENPIEQERLYREFIFRWIDERTEKEPMSADAVLGYFAKWVLADSWARLEEAEGREILQMLKG